MTSRSAPAAAVAAALSLALLAACGSGEPSTDTTASNSTSTSPTTSPTTTSPVMTTTTTTTTTETFSTTVPTTIPTSPPVFAFTTTADRDGWLVVNDTVMGGVSNGELAWSAGALTFAGELSLANNGGFASIRSPEIDPRTATDWAGRPGVRVEADGDGRTWTMELRTGGESGGWIRAFPTEPTGTTVVELPWTSFEPVTRFLEPRSTSDVLDPARITNVAFFLVDGREGPYRLGLRSIS